MLKVPEAAPDKVTVKVSVAPTAIEATAVVTEKSVPEATILVKCLPLPK